MLTILRAAFLTLIVAGFLNAATGTEAAAETVPIWGTNGIVHQR